MVFFLFVNLKTLKFPSSGSLNSQEEVLGPYNTSDYPITIVVIPLIYIVVALLPPCCYFCAP